MALPPPTEKIVKITAFAYKLPHISTEEFVSHWRKDHVEKFMKNPEVATKMLGYTQVRCIAPQILGVISNSSRLVPS
jgi:hypothetical protein